MRVRNARTIKAIFGIIFAMTMLLSEPVLAQDQDNSAPPPSSDPTSAAPSSVAPPSAASNSGYRGRREGCWQIAGIPRSVAEQGKEIERNAHAQVQGVCSDPSLNPMQRQQQIRQIRQGERRQLEGIISPLQIQEYRACRQERGEHTGLVGGCGNMPPPQSGENGQSVPPPQDDAPRQ